MPVVTPPPAAKKTAGSRSYAAPKSKYAERAEGLQGYGQLFQAGLIAFHQYADAGAVGIHGPKLADEVAKLADIDERVANLIDPIIQAGPYSALITAVLPFALQIGVNHGWIKAGAMGTTPKETLSARIEAGLAQMQAQALRDQMEAEAETQRLQEQIRQARNIVPVRAEAV